MFTENVDFGFLQHPNGKKSVAMTFAAQLHMPVEDLLRILKRADRETYERVYLEIEVANGGHDGIVLPGQQ